jgi:hypothetical protein
MKTKPAAWLLALVTFSCLSVSARAEALRCGTRLIAEGDHFSKLLRYCGEPDSVQSRTARRVLAGLSGQVVLQGFSEEMLIEEWTYNFGPHKLMRIVRFENGWVADIRALGYGFRP